MMCAALALASAATFGAARKELQVSADAVWNPGAPAIERIRNECAKGGSDCVMAKMAGSASPAAVAFAKSIGGEGWLRDFCKVGRVDLAYVEYPLRASGGEGWMLVNGSTSPVDVDNLQKLPKSAMADNRAWSQLIALKPRAALFPADRMSVADPVALVYADGSEEFVVAYAVRDGCSDCAQLGAAFLGFEFNAKGKQAETEFLGFDPDANAARPIRVNAGRKFTLALKQEPNHEWSISQAPAKWILRDAGQTTRGSTLFWSFDVISNGATQMILAWSDGAETLPLRIIAEPGLGR
jgi:predicted secreted protein